MDVQDDYEAMRQANIRKNMEILLSLGLQPVSKKAAPSLLASKKPKLSAAVPRTSLPVPSTDKSTPDSEQGRVSNAGVKNPKPQPIVVIPTMMTRRRSGIQMSRSSSNDTSPTSSSSQEETQPLRRSGRKRRAPSRIVYESRWGGRSSASDEEGDEDSDLTSLSSREGTEPYPSLSPSQRSSLLSKRRELDRLDCDARKSQPNRLPTRIGKRLHDPKTFGPIPGISIGHWWASRMEVSTSAVHAPPVSGISGNREVGCWSIALSGGYEDDLEIGQDQFTYTGCGGRKLSGNEGGRNLNLRTAPQTSDQSFEWNLNAALVKSCETGLPIRVIKGFKDVKSDFSPPTGYVYQGLFLVEKCWMQTGLSGFKVCKFAFRRREGQEPMRCFREEKERLRREREGEGEEVREERERPTKNTRRREREVIVIESDSDSDSD